LTRLYYPTMFSRVDVLYWRWVQRILLHRIDCIIAISESTKRDLVRFYHLPPEKIHVIFPAISAQFKRQKGTEEVRQSVLEKYHIQPPYILSVGGMAVHKNVYTALRAFYALLDRGLLSDYTFVIVGDQVHTHNDKRLFELAHQRQQKHVCFTGLVDDEEIPYIYSSASLLVYPSLYEGFGLVALEAMRCGTPVLASRLGSVPEVVGDAACFLEDPLDIASFADTLAALLTNPRRLADMRARGLQRSLAFTWEATAAQTLALYDEVCDA
jgi:glycosyltransferase involved in cell wall biosynthesis